MIIREYNGLNVPVVHKMFVNIEIINDWLTDVKLSNSNKSIE